MKHSFKRISTIGTTAAAISLIAFGSIASACSIFDNSSSGGSSSSGSGSSSASSSTSTASYSSQNSSSGGNNNWGDDNWQNNWTNWNPETTTVVYSSYTEWWNGIVRQINTCKHTWKSDYSNASWTPQSDNWQQQWSNWNPVVWQVNGSSYTNWRTQFVSFMNAQQSSIQNNYGSNNGNDWNDGDNGSSNGDNNGSPGNGGNSGPGYGNGGGNGNDGNGGSSDSNDNTSNNGNGGDNY